MENKGLMIGLIVLALVVGWVVGFMVGKRKGVQATQKAGSGVAGSNQASQPAKTTTVEKPAEAMPDKSQIKTA
jgi:hypothetical protein